MLKKIINITSEVPTYIKKQVKSNYQNHAPGYTYVNRDSQHISEAGKFLKKRNWKLKKLTVKDKNVYLEISISGFLFCADINLPVSSGIEYTVSRDIAVNAGGAKIRFFASSSISDAARYPEFKYLTRLFDRIENAGFDKHVALDRNVYFDYLFDDLKGALQNEFTLLNFWLLKFLNMHLDNITSLETGSIIEKSFYINGIQFD